MTLVKSNLIGTSSWSTNEKTYLMNCLNAICKTRTLNISSWSWRADGLCLVRKKKIVDNHIKRLPSTTSCVIRVVKRKHHKCHVSSFHFWKLSLYHVNGCNTWKRVAEEAVTICRQERMRSRYHQTPRPMPVSWNFWKESPNYNDFFDFPRLGKSSGPV